MENYDIMYLAKVQAEVTSKLGIGGPFGAAILDSEGNIITVDSNTVLRDNDPTAHAEMNAIRSACKLLGTHDLSGYTLYATGYPCPMCMSAIIWANIKKVIYACPVQDAEQIGFRDDFIYRFIETKCLNKAILDVEWAGPEERSMCKMMYLNYELDNKEMY